MRSPSGIFKRWLATALLLGAVVLLTGACEGETPQGYLDPDGRVAEQADDLWNITFWIAAAVFVIVEGLIVFALVKFRHKPGRRAAQFHGNTRVEVILTVVPSLILAGLAVPTVKTIFDLAEQPPSDAIHITVTGRQFWWKYEYHDYGFNTANEMHIPVGKPVEVTVTGDDVIHSWWVPRLSGKLDAIPGRTNSITLYADRAGKYLGQCTEFCGPSHANMRLIVYAEPQAQFEEWISGQQEESTATPPEGFIETCGACHAVAGTDAQADIGPDLTHFGSRTTFAAAMFDLNEENLAAWLRDPKAVKPDARMPDYNLPEEQIQELVDYLMSLE